MDVIYFQSNLSEGSRRALDGVRRFAGQAGWNLTVIHYAMAAKVGDDAGRINTPGRMNEVLAGRRPDGCIVEDSAVWQRMFPIVERHGVPCVVYDAQFPASREGCFTCVNCDNAAVVDAVARELFTFRFSDYAFVPHHESLCWSKMREDAFRNAVAGQFANFHVYRNRDRNVNVVSAGLVEWLKRLPRPCGLFAVNDHTALRVLEAAKIAGISVPFDMPVVSVDDDKSKCETISPSLTSVQIDVEGGGYAAAEALSECMATGKRQVKDRMFGVAYLMRRVSSCRMRIPDSKILSALEIIRRDIHAGNGIVAEDVAHKMNMPLRTLHRRFLNAVGHTLGHEIREMRFEMAKRKLESTCLPVEAVAGSCGYDSASTLRKLFATRLGCSPVRWRKSLRR